MTTFKVIYIDDDKDESDKIDALVRGLSSQGKIDLVMEYPEELEKYVDYLQQKYRDANAFLIDLKINENRKGRRHYATYPAQILASAIRTYQNGGDKKFEEIPVFLISSFDKKKDYITDTSSHDTFDFFILKNDISNLGVDYENMMCSFISAYKAITSTKELYRLMNIEAEEFNALNIPYDSFQNKLISESSQFIFNELILRNGVLINEDVLASRLGINYESSDDWNKLKLKLKNLKYEGVFSDAWDRWWSHRLLDWWEDEFPQDKYLIQLNAEKRVELLMKKYSLTNLSVATPIEKNLSSYFWTICQVSRKPLDSLEGLLVNKRYENWQEKEYVSLKAILDRESFNLGIKLHPSEKGRFNELKEKYKN